MSKRKKHRPSLYNTLLLKGYTHEQAVEYLDCTDRQFSNDCSEASTIIRHLDGGVTPPKGTEQ